MLYNQKIKNSHFKSTVLLTGLLLMFCACKESDTTSYKTLDLGHFSVEIPLNWQYEEIQGIDSFVGQIEGKGIKINFDFSVFGYANNLMDSEFEYIYIGKKWKSSHFFLENGVTYVSGNVAYIKREMEKQRSENDNSEIVVSLYPNPEISIYKTNDSIKLIFPVADYIANLTFNDSTITVPIQLPEEITQHTIKIDTIDSFIVKKIQPTVVGKGMTGVYFMNLDTDLSFSFFAEDLNKKNQKAMLKAIESIKIKERIPGDL